MRLRWTRLALEDLNYAFEYVAAENPSAACAIIGRIEAAVNALRAYPDLGRPGRIEGTRELVIAGTPFLILYRIAKGRIEVLAVIHGARRWPDSL